MILTIIVFIVILSILILVHELGHFLAARYFGVKVEEFAYGFGPKLITKKRGDTTWSLRAIPIGGFVRMKGEDEEKEGPDSFSSKPIWQRTIIVLAGVTMNFLLAILIFTFAFSAGTPLLVSSPQSHPKADVKTEIILLDIEKDSPAEKVGIKTGDILLGAADLQGSNITFKSAEEVSDFTKNHKGQKVNVNLLEDGKEISKEVTLNSSDAPLGIAPFAINKVTYPFYLAPVAAVTETGRAVKISIVAVFNLFKSIFVQFQIPEDVRSPVTVYMITSEVIKFGLPFIISFLATLSIIIGVFNAFPYPPLDGGRLIFLVAEKVKGKRASIRVENMIQFIGFASLMLLLGFLVYRDIIYYWVK